MTNQPLPRELTRDASVTWLALFASIGTLVCCALPILLVTAGFGTTVAAVTSSVPALVTLVNYKAWFFAISALLMMAGWWIAYRRDYACPPDSALAAVCERVRRCNKRILWLGAAVWSVGFFAAYLLLPIRIWLDV
jgi:hypothetical protein